MITNNVKVLNPTTPTHQVYPYNTYYRCCTQIIVKALVYNGAKDVRIDDKPKPEIKDIILRVTSTALCGSDLHLFHGTLQGMEPGQTLGHEFMGIVEEKGSGVDELKIGDPVFFNGNGEILTTLQSFVMPMENR
jgi:NADPH:quinone reductase-like Zn-dependent oxidoreductase